uniref:hypothetical protein n=1 Tax=Burkholderia ambifaria TaxID=152480 RepID=UPI001ABAD628
SVNLLVFMAWPSCPLGHIMPNFSTFEPDYFLGQGHHRLQFPASDPLYTASDFSSPAGPQGIEIR